MQVLPQRLDGDSTAHATHGKAPIFDYHPRTRVVFGSGVLSSLGTLARELGGKKILLVTDAGLERAGHPGRAVESLRNAELHVTVFDDVHTDPTTDDVDRGLRLAQANGVDLIVGLGGGSSMDVAKGINFLLTNGGRMEDYWGVGKATKPMLPMIAVPTTSGTGSEAQSFALIANAKTHMKMACGDPKAACRIALLDPDLTRSMPASVTAATGIDAISHALETYVTNRRGPISQLFSRQAWQLLSRGFPAVIEDIRNDTARADMLLGAHLAGAAIENSMLGATHALANPLSAHCSLTHGVAIGIMLPHVILFNASATGRSYGDLASDAGLCDKNDPGASRFLASHITSLVVKAGMPTRLRDCHVDAKLIPQLAIEAAAQWTGKFNPRPVDADSLTELYECAL